MRATLRLVLTLFLIAFAPEFADAVPATATPCAASSQRYVYIRPGEAPGV